MVAEIMVICRHAGIYLCVCMQLQAMEGLSAAAVLSTAAMECLPSAAHTTPTWGMYSRKYPVKCA